MDNSKDKELENKALKELESYEWSSRKDVYIGKSIVPKNTKQVYIFDMNSKKGKLKRNGKDYWYFNNAKDSVNKMTYNFIKTHFQKKTAAKKKSRGI